jgi:flavodoxin
MKTLIIYDSTHGNTQMVAQAMGDAIGGRVSLVSDVKPAELSTCDLVMVGSPTHGGFPTEGIHNLLKTPLVFKDARVAVFDTRTKTTMFGYAAPKMAKIIQKNGAHLLAQPEGFFVRGIKGPLLVGELERAVLWAKGVMCKYQDEKNG